MRTPPPRTEANDYVDPTQRNYLREFRSLGDGLFQRSGANNRAKRSKEYDWVEARDNGTYRLPLRDGAVNVSIPKHYRRLAKRCRSILHEKLFERSVNATILLVETTLMISLVEDPSSMQNTTPQLRLLVFWTDVVACVIFSIEILVRIMAEGPRPLHFFLGNFAGANVFDFIVVVFTVVLTPLRLRVSFIVQMVRVLRLFSVLNRTPETRVILRGIFAGIKAVGSIMTLLLLLLYVYGIVGVNAFGANDPAHFGSVQQSMLSLFVISTLNGWLHVYAINYHGCEKFSSEDGSSGASSNGTAGIVDSYEQRQLASDVLPRKFDTKYGVFFSNRCDNSTARPVLAQLYFYSFTMLTAFIILSLFISVIEMAMFEAMEHSRQGGVQNEAGFQQVQRTNERRDAVVKRFSVLAVNRSALYRNTRNAAIEKLLHGPRGFDIKTTLDRFYGTRKVEGVDDQRAPAAVWANRIIESRSFNLAIVFTILLAAVAQGVDTNSAGNDDTLWSFELAICVALVAECVVKFVASGDTPLRYFHDWWNVFDLVIAVLTVCSYGADGVPAVTALRLLRLVKVVKKYPALHVAVQSLIKAFKTVGYVGVAIALINFNFAVVGMVLFRKNDPAHFGTLTSAMVTIWSVSTLDAWDEVMYTNMYGCKNYGYPTFGRRCNHSSGYGWVAACYFVTIVLLGAMLFPTVVIGLISIASSNKKSHVITPIFRAAFEQSTNEMREEQHQESIISEIKDRTSTWEISGCIPLELENIRALYVLLAHEQSIVDNGDRDAIVREGVSAETLDPLLQFIVSQHLDFVRIDTLRNMFRMLIETDITKVKFPHLLWVMIFTAKMKRDKERRELLLKVNANEATLPDRRQHEAMVRFDSRLTSFPNIDDSTADMCYTNEGDWRIVVRNFMCGTPMQKINVEMT